MGQDLRAIGRQVRPHPLPQPISVPMTVLEASSVHVLLTALIEGAPQQLHALEQITRVRDEIERRLTKAGCVLDAEGWRA